MHMHYGNTPKRKEVQRHGPGYRLRMWGDDNAQGLRINPDGIARMESKRNITNKCIIMSKGKSRTLSICVSDIPKERLMKHENGKVYLLLQTYDYDEPDKFDNDFSVSMQLTKAEQEAKKNGEKVDRIFLGNGRIWPDKGMQQLSEEEHDDLPF